MRMALGGVALLIMAFVAVFAQDWDAVSPDETQVLLAKAKVAADNYQVEEAVALYTKAIDSGRLTPAQLIEAYSGRAEARKSYTIAHGIKDGEMMLALGDYQKARELRASDFAYLREAHAWIVLGGYGEATDAYRKAIVFERPKPYWSLIGVARVARIQGHYDAALKQLDEVLSMWSAEPGMPVLYHRARVLFLQEKYAAVAEALDQGMQYQKDYAFAYFYRGCAHAHLGDFVKAMTDAAKAIALAKAPPVNEAWEKTPAAKTMHDDLAANFALIKAMAEGARDADRAKLCETRWNSGENRRERSPLLDTPVASLSATPAADASASGYGPSASTRTKASDEASAVAPRRCTSRAADCTGS
jgi:tetratricopeptide (TPR) repeat protein